MRTCALVGCFIFLAKPVHAGELIHSYVNHDGDHYILHLDMRVEGKYDDIYRILIDFDNITAVNDTIVFSKLLKSEGKVHTVHFESEGCIWFFCRRVKQVVKVTELGRGYIMSATDPTRSDLEYGRTLWEVIDEGKTTRIKYNADYVPDFWIPPLIGPYLFKNRMLEEGQKTINGIEALANDDTELF